MSFHKRLANSFNYTNWQFISKSKGSDFKIFTEIKLRLSMEEQMHELVANQCGEELGMP